MLTRRHSLAMVAGAALLPRLGRAAPPAGPVGPDGPFELVNDWTFGNARPDATVTDMVGLKRDFRFKYIYGEGRLDGLPTYWSKHRDYPEGDPRSLHVFSADHLTLKGRIPDGGGLHPGGIESGMLRALPPVTPGMYVEMRTRLPRGLGVWPAFWLNPGVERRDGTFSDTPWPPEIDIFEFFVWQGRSRPTILESNVQVNGHPEKFGDPQDVFTKFTRGKYDPGIDFSADFHVFGLDWHENLPVWYLDGERIKATRYEWPAPPAHILVTNQIGINLPGVDMSGMKANPSDWDYAVDYIRLWRRSPV